MNRFYAGPKLPQIPLYDLYGVVNHHGSLLGGHYTAYARCLDQYDSSVTEIGMHYFIAHHFLAHHFSLNSGFFAYLFNLITFWFRTITKKNCNSP